VFVWVLNRKTDDLTLVITHSLPAARSAAGMCIDGLLEQNRPVQSRDTCMHNTQQHCPATREFCASARASANMGVQGQRHASSWQISLNAVYRVRIGIESYRRGKVKKPQRPLASATHYRCAVII
jgi:hypothetical protein